jgi:hypothetical protein
VSGDVDSNDCPTPYQRITDERECKAAANDMGLTYGRSDKFLTFPAGCSRDATSPNVNLNTNMPGVKSPNSKLLCSGAPLSLAAVMESESERVNGE